MEMKLTLRIPVGMNNDLQSRFVVFIGIESQEIIVQIEGMGDQRFHIAFPGSHIVNGTREIVHLTAYAYILLVIIMQIIQKLRRIIQLYL